MLSFAEAVLLTDRVSLSKMHVAAAIGYTLLPTSAMEDFFL